MKYYVLKPIINRSYLASPIKPYSKLGSEKYIYQLKSSDLTHELKKFGELYYDIYEYVKIKYSDTKEFNVFESVYNEHFTIVEGKAEAKLSKNLHSGMLQ